MVEWFFNYSALWHGIVFLSSLVVLFKWNLLEWGNHFWGKFYCERAISWWVVLVGSNCPRGRFPQGQLSGGIIRVGNFPRGNFPLNPKADTHFYHLFLFFEVEKNSQGYEPNHDTSTHVFKQLNQIVRFK